MSATIQHDGANSGTTEAYTENLAKLALLREHLATLAVDQQAYYDRDGNMDNWATKMRLLQFNIGEAIVHLESTGGKNIAETPDETAWAEGVREDRRRR